MLLISFGFTFLFNLPLVSSAMGSANISKSGIFSYLDITLSEIFEPGNFLRRSYVINFLNFGWVGVYSVLINFKPKVNNLFLGERTNIIF